MLLLSKWHRVCSIIIGILLCILSRFHYISQHDQHEYDSNPWTFAQKFNLIPFYRTNLHSKGLKHWYEWVELNAKFIASAKAPLTLLHFDTHAYTDVISDEIYECSPGQFFQYDQMVIEILQLTEDLIDNFIDLEYTNNITDQMMKIGYFPKVIWVYPDHWANFSTVIAFDVHYELYQKYARHQTYYVTPLKGLRHQYSMLKSEKYPSDKHEFWDNILFQNSIEMVNSELNATKSVKIEIMAIPLSELQSIEQKHHIVLDIDLDFFCCQSIAENMMERFEWGKDLTQQLNTILTHHQYLPNHIPNGLYQNALITLMHILTKNEKIPMNDKYLKTHANDGKQMIKVPKILDLVKLASEKDSVLSAYDLQHTLHFLYRFQLEMGKEYMESISLFLLTHAYLDQILNEIGDIKWETMPYNHSKHRKKWHRNLAKALNMQHALTQIDQTSVGVNPDGTVTQADNDEFEQNILPHLRLIKDKIVQETEDTQEQQRFEDINEEISDSNNDIITIAHRLKQLLQSTEYEHKISQHLIETYLNETKQNTSVINLQNIANFIMNQTTKIWNVNHDWFHTKLQKKQTHILKKTRQDSLEYLSYPQILQRFGINPSYKYFGWDDIVNKFRNESWTNNYVRTNKSEPILTEKGPKPFNKSELELTTHNINEIINWNKLDRIQKHFLQRSDHSAMTKFIKNLNPKQNLFLKWLLFCFYHSQNCEDGHNPFELVNNNQITNVIFGERFPWDEMIRIPSFVESVTAENRGLLQLEFISLGRTQKWLETAKHERKHIPTKHQIKQTINKITEFLSLESNVVIAGGIELSKAYVPFKYQKWMECWLLRSVNKALYRNNSKGKISFLTYQHFVADNSESDLHRHSIFRKIPKCLQHIVSTYI